MLPKFITALSALALVFQLGACCCNDADGNRWVSSVRSCCASRGEGDRCIHDRDEHHEEDAIPHSDHEFPGGHSHHICIGSHMFFVVQPSSANLAAELSQASFFAVAHTMSTIVDPSPDADIQIRALRDESPCSTLPLRAQLQIYLL